jgi:putative ABC transport system permease protein
MTSALSQLSLFALLFFTEAARALRRNKLRSFLASLAITIGIAALVCVVALGRAASLVAEQTLLNLGDNLIQVEAGSRSSNGVRTGSHGTTTLTAADAQAILEEVPLVTRVTPNVDSSAQVIFRGRNWRTRIRGVSPDYLDIKRWPVSQGAPFTDEDVRATTSVCLVGQTVVEHLFGNEDPVGQIVRINAQLFRVAGVLGKKGQSATGQDQDDALLMPWTSAQSKVIGARQTYVDDIFASAGAPELVNPAIEQITALLRQRHHIPAEQGDDFNLRRQDEFIKAQIETSHTLESLLTAIACISLLVGGVGVMNIMLVSVAERTREIGLRLAVGATEALVQLQFLGEAVLLALIGGSSGAALGIGCALLLGATVGWPIVIPAEAVLIALAFSGVIGLVCGFYPARVASRLNPIEALRHE